LVLVLVLRSIEMKPQCLNQKLLEQKDERILLKSYFTQQIKYTVLKQPVIKTTPKCYELFILATSCVRVEKKRTVFSH